MPCVLLTLQSITQKRLEVYEDLHVFSPLGADTFLQVGTQMYTRTLRITFVSFHTAGKSNETILSP